MPLHLKQQIDSDISFGIWKIEEANSFFEEKLDLSNAERLEIESFSDKRKNEWMSARILIHHLSPLEERLICMKDQFGKPFLKGTDQNISISHSHDYSAAILGKKTVGIDIQKIVAKIERIGRKFLTETELNLLTPSRRIEELHIYWGAKEALYKAYGRKQLGFIEHIKIDAFDSSKKHIIFSGRIEINGFKQEYKISSFSFKDYILVYAQEL